MRVYLDSCVISRITDEPTSQRVILETDASLQPFRLIRLGQIAWVSGVALDFELLKNPDEAKRKDALELLAYATERLQGDRTTLSRARELQGLGYGVFDGFHLASAEQGGADTLLTTDDRFLRLANRNVGAPRVTLANPVEWLRRTDLWRR
jgi:predicted nucleic acid-binding protein